MRSSSREEQGESLSRMLPTGVAERIRARGAHPGDSEQLNVTVLMSDIRGYSTISEHTDPSLLAQQLNRHRAEMNSAILSAGGTVMQYVGDAVMAVFGAPEPASDHADRALVAAAAMHAAQVGGQRANGRRRVWSRSRLGIGLSSGDVAAALLGSEERLEYTVVGDAVNLCQRLQQFAADGEIVVSDVTWEQLSREASSRGSRRAPGQGPEHTGSTAKDRIHQPTRRFSGRHSGDSVMTISEPSLDDQNVTEDLVVNVSQVFRTFEQDTAPVRALRGADLDIGRGEFVAVMGPSGCGKSTLLNIVAGLDVPDEGEVSVAGEALVGKTESELAIMRRQHIGIVFQFFNLLEGMTALENVLMPALIAGRKRKAAETRGSRSSGSARHRRQGQAVAGRVVGWPAPTPGDRQGTRQRANVAVGRRADRRTRLGRWRGGARAVHPPALGRPDDLVGHPRPARGRRRATPRADARRSRHRRRPFRHRSTEPSPMAAALLWARTNLRSQWRSAALVVLIAGLCASVSMAAIAGARRTSTSFARFVRATKDTNIFVAVPDRATADLATSVLRRGVDPRYVAEAVFLAAKPNTLDKNDEFNLAVIGDVGDTIDRTVVFSKIVAGRLPTGARDVAVNDLAAQRFGVGPGDHLQMVGYSPHALEACSSDPSACVTDLDLGDVTVTGILRAPSDISPESADSLSIGLSRALTKSWLASVADQLWLSGAFVESSTTRADLGTALTSAIGPDRFTGERGGCISRHQESR